MGGAERDALLLILSLEISRREMEHPENFILYTALFSLFKIASFISKQYVLLTLVGF